MDTSIIALCFSVAAALSGIILGWAGKSRTVKQDTAQQASLDERMRVSVDYIRQGFDDMRLEMRVQGQRFDVLSERVTRVEESIKQAHNRIDEIKKGGA